MLLHAARRIALIFGALIAGTVALSALIGLAAGSSLARSASVGLYVAGVLLLVGCFVMGARGPLRGVNREGEAVPTIGARRIRRATGNERADSTHIAILLFALGLGLVVLGALIDPGHQAF